MSGMPSPLTSDGKRPWQVRLNLTDGVGCCLHPRHRLSIDLVGPTLSGQFVALGSVDERERTRHRLEWLALCPDPDRQLDYGRADHQCGAEEVAEKHRATLAATDQGPEHGGRRDAAKGGPDCVEERDRQRPGFEREALADCQ